MFIEYIGKRYTNAANNRRYMYECVAFMLNCQLAYAAAQSTTALSCLACRTWAATLLNEIRSTLFCIDIQLYTIYNRYLCKRIETLHVDHLSLYFFHSILYLNYPTFLLHVHLFFVVVVVPSVNSTI